MFVVRGRARPLLGWALCLALASPSMALADEGETVAEGAADPTLATDRASEEKVPVRLEVKGYFQPRVGVTYRPEAIPRDRYTYGASDSRTGVVLSGEPVPKWRYTLHLVIGANLFEHVTSAEDVDRDGDGTIDDVVTTSESVPGLFIEEASVAYDLNRSLELKVGQMRIPFTMQHQSPNTALLFPQRSGPNQAFLSGTDAGVLASLDAMSGTLRGSLGAFGGAKQSPLTREGLDEQGLLFSGRVDYAPLGGIDRGGTDMYRGPFRAELGAGLIYHPAALFDDAGFSQASLTDIRFSASARIRGGGFHLQGEFFTRRREDSVSSRPDSTLGAYAQAHMLVASTGIGIAPIGRFGWTEEDRDVSPRTTLFAEAGLLFYLRPESADPDALKLVVQYVGEFRRTESENAHGALTQIQKSF